MYIHGVKITKREAITSIVIVFLLLFIGFFISNAIADNIADSNAVYYTAVKINNDETQFNYGMTTNIGNALVYGELTTIDPVTMDGVLGKYLYIQKRYEHYTMHTRTVSHSDGKGGTYTTVETYYTWDYTKREENTATRVSFLNKEFPVENFDIGWSSHLSLNIETVSKDLLDDARGNYVMIDSNDRYYYEVIPTNKIGSILVRLADNTAKPIFGSKINILEGTPSEIVQYKQDSEDTPIIIFWIFWTIGIIVAVIIYVAHENDWLEPIKKRIVIRKD